LEETRSKKLRGLLEKTTIESIREQDIVDMVEDWRARKRKSNRR